MDDFEKHLEKVSAQLHGLAPYLITGFMAWVLYPIGANNSTTRFVERKSGGELLLVIERFLQSCWNGTAKKEDAAALKKLLVAFEWDDAEVEMEEEDAAQGAVDYLGGVELLTKNWGSARRLSQAEDCALQIFERLNYKIDFSEDESVIKRVNKLISTEKSNQLKIIKHLAASGPSERPIETLHQELIGFLAED